MELHRMKRLGEHLSNHGLTTSDLKTHAETLKLIGYCGDGRTPYEITQSRSAFELWFRNEIGDRKLVVHFTRLGRGLVRLHRFDQAGPQTPAPMPANTYQIQDAFDWMLEGEQRANYAKEIVEDILKGFIPPFIFVEYTPRGKRTVELDRRKYFGDDVQKIYDAFKRDYPEHEHGLIVIYARTSSEPPVESMFKVDPIVLEKAFYTGDFRPDTVLEDKPSLIERAKRFVGGHS